MSETTNEEKLELSKSEAFSNYCDTMAMPIVWLATAQWIVTGWIAQWRYAKRRGRKFKLQWPHKLEVSISSGRPQMVIENLRSFGISTQGLSSQWVVDGSTKAMQSSMLVAESQWQMADAILAQLAEGEYIVTSAPGTKRGAVFSERWGVTARARSFDEGLNAAIGTLFEKELKTPVKSGKLGKTYW